MQTNAEQTLQARRRGFVRKGATLATTSSTPFKKLDRLFFNLQNDLAFWNTCLISCQNCNQIYACGGYDGSSFLRSVEVFDPVANK
jgi:hypothetical protein